MDFTGYGQSTRGQLEVILTSPAGTSSTLLPLRSADKTSKGYDNWPFMSVHFWGENPTGEWMIITRNYNYDSGETAHVDLPGLVLYGTSSVPEAVSRIPSQCSPECDPSRGCAAIGAEFCDACAKLRIASTLECTTSCPQGLQQRNSYCYEEGREAFCDAVIPRPLPLKANSALAKMATKDYSGV